jgi:hypothetical protein
MSDTYRVMLTTAQIIFHADYAPVACGYWANDRSLSLAERLPSRGKLTQALSKGLCFTAAQLRAIANEDRTSTDIIVQIALFGKLVYG